MEPMCWGDAPTNTGLYYNNDKEIGAILSKLVNSHAKDRFVIVESESASISDASISHISWLLCHMLGFPVNVFWFLGYPSSNFGDAGMQLRRFYLDLWKKQDFSIIGETEYIALSLEMATSSSPGEYFDENLSALISKSTYANILFVFDLQAVGNHHQQAGIVALADRVVAKAAAGWRGGIVVQASHGVPHAEIKLVAPDPEVSSLFASRRSSSPMTGLRPAPDAVLAEAVKIIHPLIVLNQPTQISILDYVIQHTPEIEDEVRSWLQQEALWRLGKGRIRLSPTALSFAASTSAESALPPIFRDTVPNGAKILAFQAPHQLVTQVSGLDDILSFSREATRLIDEFALMIWQKNSNDPHHSATAHEIIGTLNKEKQVMVSTGRANAQSLLMYSSQLLLTRPQIFGNDFFFAT